MPLSYIINTVCEKLGYTAETQRALLLTKINRAAKEVYEIEDLPGCLRELVFQVPSDSIIALPYFVGEIRAIREHNIKVKVEIREMSPNYSYQPWPEMIRTFRVLHKSPLQRSITDATELTLTLGAVEAADVSVTITGQTTTANKVVETATITAGQTSVQLDTAFINIQSITKTTQNETNITFTDVDGNVLAIIPNDRLKSEYVLVDVSKVPYGDLAGGERYVDILYKEPLAPFQNDTDEFLCPGFDDAIVYKVFEHEYSTKPDSGDLAIAYHQKVLEIIKQRTDHSNGTTQKEIIFAPCQYFDLHPRYPYPTTPRFFGVSR